MLFSNDLTRSVFWYPGRIDTVGFGWLDQEKYADVLGNDELWMVPRSQVGVTTSPLKIQRLHRRFSKVSPSPDTVLNFANQFGFLWGPELCDVATQRHEISRGATYRNDNPDDWIGKIHNLPRRSAAEGEPKTSPVYAECFSKWCEEIAEIKKLIRWWDLARANRVTALRKEVRVDWAEDSVHLEIRDEWAKRPGPWRPTFEQPVLDKYDEPEIWEEWQDAIRDKPVLSDTVPVLDHIGRKVDDVIRDGTRTRFEYQPQRGSDLAVEVLDLRTAIYVSFALEMMENRAVATCQFCGSKFAMNRSDQRFCSTNCRRKYHYHKSKKQPSKR